MNNRKMIYGVLGLGGIIAVACSVVLYYMVHFQNTTVTFLDIGQGDAILISRGSQQIVIDGGPDSTVLLEQLGKHIPFWDRNIEIVIATHPDADHIDGLIGVFKNYSVDQFWHTNVDKETSVYRALMHYAKNETDVENIIAYHGLSALLDGQTHLDVVFPFDDDMRAVSDANDASIVTLFYVGQDVFYFGGDLPSEIEDTLPIGDDITVLKAGHHGSRRSTSAIFLEQIKPRDVIISAGRDNRYRHPHADVLERVASLGARIFRTDESGSIIYTCTTDECTVRTK